MPGSTTRLALPYPLGSDPADGPDGFQDLANPLDNAAIDLPPGTLTARPPAATRGRWYRATNGGLYYDKGSGWDEVVLGTDARLTDQRVPTDNSVTNAKMADNAVGNAEMQDGSVGAAEIINGSVTSQEIADGLKPSVSAPNGTEALRALGTAPGTAAAGDDARIPTSNQKDALAGSSGAPSNTNKYVTNADARNTDQRVPTDGSVTNAKMADNAVGKAEIIDDSVGAAELDVLPGCRLRRSADLAIGAGVTTQVGFDTEVFDVDNMHAAGTPTRITFTTAGRYLVVAQIQHDKNTYRDIRIKLNGGAASFIGRKQAGIGSGIGTQQVDEITAIYQFAAGDYVEVEFLNIDAATVTVNGGAFASVFSASFLSP